MRKFSNVPNRWSFEDFRSNTILMSHDKKYLNIFVLLCNKLDMENFIPFFFLLFPNITSIHICVTMTGDLDETKHSRLIKYKHNELCVFMLSVCAI